MAVRVYYERGQQPKEYAEASIALERSSRELKSGSMTIADYGIHVGEDDTELLIPWSALQRVTLKMKGE